ncbi:MAG: transcriptional regulator, AraC family [Bacilli bacterium]|nr:transcriptional regulator, AraC family [Bacilli bacterium]
MKMQYRKTTPVKPILRSHVNYEIFYFHEGKGNYLIGDKILELLPGDILVLQAMTPHCPQMQNDARYVRTIIQFDPAYIQVVLQQLFSINLLDPFEVLGHYRMNLSGADRAEMEAVLVKMHSLYTNKDLISGHRFRLCLIDVLMIIYGLFQQPMVAKLDYPSEKERNVQNIISFLDSHYTEDIHLTKLEEHLHLSRHHLSRIFREITGVTIFDYLYQRRINQAKILFLLEVNKTVTDVCFELGFKHLTHFSRIFKKFVGYTPEQFKKQIKTSIRVQKKIESSQSESSNRTANLV